MLYYLFNYLDTIAFYFSVNLNRFVSCLNF